MTYPQNKTRFEQLSPREKWGKKTWATEKSMLHYAKQIKKTPILAAHGELLRISSDGDDRRIF